MCDRSSPDRKALDEIRSSVYNCRYESCIPATPASVMPEWVYEGIGNERELAEAFAQAAATSFPLSPRIGKSVAFASTPAPLGS
jgi:hypothetical protein